MFFRQVKHTNKTGCVVGKLGVANNESVECGDVRFGAVNTKIADGCVDGKLDMANIESVECADGRLGAVNTKVDVCGKLPVVTDSFGSGGVTVTFAKAHCPKHRKHVTFT